MWSLPTKKKKSTVYKNSIAKMIFNRERLKAFHLSWEQDVSVYSYYSYFLGF